MAAPGAAPAYRRVLLKISGEALAGGQGYGIDPDVIGRTLPINRTPSTGLRIRVTPVPPAHSPTVCGSSARRSFKPSDAFGSG